MQEGGEIPERQAMERKEPPGHVLPRQLRDLPIDCMARLFEAARWRSLAHPEVAKARCVCRRWRDDLPVIVAQCLVREISYLCKDFSVRSTEKMVRRPCLSEVIEGRVMSFLALPAELRAPHETTVRALLDDPCFRKRRWQTEEWNDHQVTKEDSDHSLPSDVVRALQENNHERALVLSCEPMGGYEPYIGPEGARQMFEALTLNTTVRIVDLHWNPLGEEAAMHLGRALAANTSVERLKVTLRRSDWSKEELGVRLFAESLHSNTTLKTLEVTCPASCQEILGVSAVGARYLFGMLRVNTGLEHFSYNGAFEWDGGVVPPLDWDDLDPNENVPWTKTENTEDETRALQVLAEALERNTHLLELDLHTTFVDDKNAGHIAAALLKNSSLLVIRLKFITHASERVCV